MDGLELKIKRIRNGIKGKDLASILKVSSAYISMVENNKEIPSTALLKSWVKILKD